MRTALARFVAFTLLLTVALVAGCGKVRSASQGTVRVFAAASTADALKEIAKSFEQRTGCKVVLNLAGTATLAQQVEQGAPADLFLSADEKWANALSDKQLVARRRKLLGNRLVLIVPARVDSSVKRLEDLADSGVAHVALAETSSVPAGRYARAALEKLELWAKVSPKVVAGDDVRQALLFVERGEAEAGIVYATDAALSKNVRVVTEIDPKLHAPVVYPWLVLKQGAENPHAVKFYDELTSPEAIAVFKRFGFSILNDDAEVTKVPSVPASAAPQAQP
ncbi:MAG: molybdate ABC transporter substrate-binding protein [Planctomycetes bacterium]|nr:molybdate ABC transporter substrate-binding protein [Planctomycetota bacterium]